MLWVITMDAQMIVVDPAPVAQMTVVDPAPVAQMIVEGPVAQMTVGASMIVDGRVVLAIAEDLMIAADHHLGAGFPHQDHTGIPA